MSLWCNVCRSFRAGDELTEDRQGKTCCGRCETRLSTNG